MLINKMINQFIVCNYIDHFINEHEYIWRKIRKSRVTVNLKSFFREVERSLTSGRRSSVLELKLFLLSILKS